MRVWICLPPLGVAPAQPLGEAGLLAATWRTKGSRLIHRILEITIFPPSVYCVWSTAILDIMLGHCQKKEGWRGGWRGHMLLRAFYGSTAYSLDVCEAHVKDGCPI